MTVASICSLAQSRKTWLALCFGAVSFLGYGIGFAQDDSGLGGNDDVKVVLALYGGVINGEAKFTDVTNKVTDLLPTSPYGFGSNAETVVGGGAVSDWHQSLLIFYNYNGHLHFFARWEDPKNKVSQGLLRELAKIDDSHIEAFVPSDSSETDPQIISAEFGTLAVFRDSTDLVKQLLRNNPDGFAPTVETMGGAPLFGFPNSVVILFEYNGKLYYYTQPDSLPKITKDILKALVPKTSS
jgi:hypothetical protein